MRNLLALALGTSVVLATALAHAQGEPPPAPPPAAPPPVQPATPAASAPAAPSAPTEDAPSDGPAARTGFQLGLRTGVQLPMGDVSGSTGNNAMSDAFSAQWPFMLEIGGKPIPNLFIGAYLLTGVGGAAGATADACTKTNISCMAVSVRLGVELQYHVAPADKINPWFGYGIGFESAAITSSSPITVSATGPEFAHFSAGLDFRLSRTVGIGPVASYSLGQYSHLEVETAAGKTSGDIKEKALHQWLMLGGRVVFFP